MITNIVTKLVIAVILVIAAIYGNSYLFNHVNPWLAILCSIVCGGVAVILIANAIKTYFSNQNKK